MRRKQLVTFAAVALAVLAVCGSLREDELECEEASIHLNACCAPKTPKIDCEYYTQSLCGTTQDFPFPAKQSRCLQKMSCAEIEEAQLCDRELHGSRSYTNEDDRTRSEGATQVCP